jgi:hypothetical protein
MIVANHDTLCPITAANEAEKLLANGKVSPSSTRMPSTCACQCSTLPSLCQVLKYDVGHFDFYEGKPHFEETLEHQIRFFREHL